MVIEVISSTGDPKSFGYTTSRNRWPVIVDNMIKDVHETIGISDPEQAKEGKQITVELEKLRDEIVNDAPLKYFI
jgi:hypothetical protein